MPHICHLKALPCRECPPKYTKSPLPSVKNAKPQAAAGASAVDSGMQLPSSVKEGQEALSASLSSQATGEDYHSLEASGVSEQSKLTSNARKSAGESDSASGNSGRSSTEGVRLFSLEKLPVSYFTIPEELRSLAPGDTYVQPRLPNYPAIDAMTIVGSKVTLFQVTRSTRHKINAGLCKVLAYLPPHLEVEWVWVMPPEIWSGKAFNVKTVPTLAQAGFSDEELGQIDVRLVEARLQAVQTQFKMAVLQLRTDEQPAEEEDAEEESMEASQVQLVPVTGESAEAGSVRSATEGAAEEHEDTGNVAESRGTAGSTRGKRSAGRTSAVLVQTSADSSIVGRHVQVRIPSKFFICLLHCSIPVTGVFASRYTGLFSGPMAAKSIPHLHATIIYSGRVGTWHLFLSSNFSTAFVWSASGSLATGNSSKRQLFWAVRRCPRTPPFDYLTSSQSDGVRK